MARTLIATALLLALAVPTIDAGPAPNDDWVNTPTQGPSPNNTHQVENVDGGECPSELVGEDPTVFVQVSLKDPSDTNILKSESYVPNATGDWGGTFEIPGGLEPGVYPLEATCNDSAIPERVSPAGLAVVLGGTFTYFTYEERSYTVIATADPPEPVESDVTVTG